MTERTNKRLRSPNGESMNKESSILLHIGYVLENIIIALTLLQQISVRQFDHAHAFESNTTNHPNA